MVGRNVIDYAQPRVPWWRRRTRTLFLLALFVVLFVIVKTIDWLGLRPGDMLW